MCLYNLNIFMVAFDSQYRSFDLGRNVGHKLNLIPNCICDDTSV